MKKILTGLFLLTAATGTLSSCRDEDKVPAPPKEDLPLVYPTATPGKNYIIYDDARLPGRTRPVIEFTVDPTKDNLDAQVRTIEVYKSYGRNEGGENNYSYTPRVKMAERSSFPFTISANTDELFADLTIPGTGGAGFLSLLPPNYNPQNPRTINNFTSASVILFTFEYVMEDGRRIVLTPLTRNGVVTGTFANPPYALRVATRTE